MTALTIFLSCVTIGAILMQSQDRSTGDEVSVVRFEALQYPALGRAARLQGIAVVRAVLDDMGNVADAIGISGNAVLLKESIANVRKWRFRPNTQHAATVVYDFKLVVGRCEPLSQFILEVNRATITSCGVEVQ